jgi:hypothetical protein
MFLVASPDERSDTVMVRDIDVGAVIDEELGDFEMTLATSHNERFAFAPTVFGIDVSAGSDEEFNNVGPPISASYG